MRIKTKDDRRVRIQGRNRGAEGICTQPGLDPPRRSDPLHGTAVIDGREQQQSETGRTLGIFAQPADVPAVPGGPDRNPQRPGLGDYQVQQAMRLHLSKAPMAIADH